MKKLFFVLIAVAAAVLVMRSGARERVYAVFGGNVGFDDLSRAIEVSISQNPMAAMVFGMEQTRAVEVFYSGSVAE